MAGETTPAQRETAPPARPGRGSPSVRERLRVGGALILGVVLGVFAVVNLDKVKVDWILGSGATPLILVIAISAILGAVLDRLLMRRLRRWGARRKAG